jgi:retron-type reverse transcriptase
MFRALRQVRRNKGAPGVDGMTVDELPGYLRTHWPEIRAALLDGSYRPQPVQQFLREGYDWVVDLDLERFFDRVVHEVLMSRVKQRTADPRLLKLIDRYLKSGVMIGTM